MSISRVPKTQPSLFIIESLRFEDESAERLEGCILRDILRLADKEVEYMYLRTHKEFKAALDRFDESKMRYLHISCHGNAGSVALTLDNISFGDLGKIIRSHLQKRRLFFSACEVVNDNLASELMPDSGCYSLIGPKRAITFGDAALMWSSSYHLIFRENPDAMNRHRIKSVLARICETFGVPFVYFGSSNKAPGYKRKTFEC